MPVNYQSDANDLVPVKQCTNLCKQNGSLTGDWVLEQRTMCSLFYLHYKFPQ